VGKKRVRTEGHASRLLYDYEEANSDIPLRLRRQLAVFALAHRVPKDTLDSLFGRPLGATPRRHQSWFWYNAMRASGLNHLWDGFVERYNPPEPQSMRDCLYWLKEQTTNEQWKLLSKRIGSTILRTQPGVIQPAHYNATTNHIWYWTRGGSWPMRHSMTRMIIFGEHLDRPDNYNTDTEKLTPAALKALEREIHGLIDPDAMLWPDALERAVAYAKERLPQMLGYKRNVGYNTVSWFFQCQVRTPSGQYAGYNPKGMYPKPKDELPWDWLP